MEYRPLGRTGVKVSVLCLGCMLFGGKNTTEESFALMDYALDAGINFIDTANVYQRGRSEEIVGEALKRSGKRQRVVLATKVHGRMAEEDVNALGNSRRHIIEQCEASLRRLQTDYIDLYQIHRPQSDIPIDETLRALDDLIRAGKIRYIGTSTYAAWQIIEALWTSSQMGLNRFVCEQPPYNLLDRRIERELLPLAQTYGLAIIPWSPLAGGLLTGKYTRANGVPAGTRFADKSTNPLGGVVYDEQRVYDVVDWLKMLADARKITLSQFALAWCVQQPGVTSPIIGPRTIEQLKDNLAALDVTITADERAQIDKIAPANSVFFPLYDADYRAHKYPRC
jgi:aryl-alcohol dehydrogenase-like predicted oxidoreductase